MDKEKIDLDKISESINSPIEKAVYLEATEKVIIQRLTGRRVCRKCSAIFHATNMPPKIENVCDVCQGELYQRADDNEETIKKRLDVYLENTAPIIKYYEKQGKLEKVNGDKQSDSLIQQFEKILNENQRAD